MLGRRVALVVVAIAFAVCGACSARLWEHPGALGDYGVPFPFGFLVVLVCLRTYKAIPVVPLFFVVWYIAFWSAMSARDVTNSDYFAAGFSGAIGAVGVALVGAITQPRLRPRSALCGAAVAGFVSGLPFGLWFAYQRPGTDSPQKAEQAVWLAISFAIWQSTVGTYLFASCNKRKYSGIVSRRKFEAALASSNPYAIVDALDSAVLLGSDWRWVQQWALLLLEHPNTDVQRTAVTALGRVAQIHHSLDLDIVIPILERKQTDSKIGGSVKGVLAEIYQFTTP
jgi:hypothetical protein